MTETDGAEAPLVLDPTQPRVADLSATFKKCSPDSGVWNRLYDAERVRFALWDDQGRDCKKHSQGDFQAKPWDGASDQRVLLADDLINDNVDVMVNAFWRSLVKAEGTQARDAAAAAVASRVLYWLIRNKLNEQLQREVELAAQYQQTYGWVVVQVGWEQRLGLRKQKLSIAEIEAYDEELPPLIMDPALEDAAVARLTELHRSYVAQELAAVELETPPALGQRQARTLVRQLRDTGRIELPIPYLCRNLPCIRALQPWRDVFVPDEQGDIQNGQVFVRELVSEEELRARALVEKYDEDWLAQAVETKGMASKWTDPLNRTQAHVHTSDYVAESEKGSSLIEVVTAFTTRLDEFGVPGVYVTVFSPHFTHHPEEAERELVARHGLLDYAHGKIPFAASAAEWWCRSLTASRGVPERAYPIQRMVKVQEDALIDRTSLTTLPPRLVPARMMDEEDEFGPAARIPVMRGDEPRFMELPGHDGVAENILKLELALADQRFGRMSAEVPPVRAQMKQQRMVSNFLSLWNEVFQQVWALTLQYLTPREFEAVAGTAKPPVQPGAIQLESSLILQTDVRDQDMDFSIKKLQAISQFVVPEDAAGVIDKTQLVRMKLMAIDPLLAQGLLVSDASASGRLLEQVNSELAMMFVGNPPKLVENDPTAASQLQYGMQVVQANPFYQKELTENPTGRFAEAVKVWTQNRQQSVEQQQNKVVGRVGVKPMEA